MAKNGGGGGVAWLALIVSLAALFFSWKAYERSGGRLDLTALDRKVSVGEDAPPDWRQALAQARESLAEQRDELEAGDVARIRKSLERSFRDAGAGARREWRDLDADLERLEGQLRQGSSRARETLDSALERIRREERRP